MEGDGLVPASEDFGLDTQTISDMFAAVLANIIEPDGTVLDSVDVCSIVLRKNIEAEREPYDREMQKRIYFRNVIKSL